MLVLTRKPAETIRIGNHVVIKVIKTARGTVKIGIDAPQDVRVVRGELLDEEKPETADSDPAAMYHGVVSDQFPHVA